MIVFSDSMVKKSAGKRIRPASTPPGAGTTPSATNAESNQSTVAGTKTKKLKAATDKPLGDLPTRAAKPPSSDNTKKDSNSKTPSGNAVEEKTTHEVKEVSLEEDGDLDPDTAQAVEDEEDTVDRKKAKAEKKKAKAAAGKVAASAAQPRTTRPTRGANRRDVEDSMGHENEPEDEGDEEDNQEEPVVVQKGKVHEQSTKDTEKPGTVIASTQKKRTAQQRMTKGKALLGKKPPVKKTSSKQNKTQNKGNKKAIEVVQDDSGNIRLRSPAANNARETKNWHTLMTTVQIEATFILTMQDTHNIMAEGLRRQEGEEDPIKRSAFYLKKVYQEEEKEDELLPVSHKIWLQTRHTALPSKTTHEPRSGFNHPGDMPLDPTVATGDIMGGDDHGGIIRGCNLISATPVAKGFEARNNQFNPLYPVTVTPYIENSEFLCHLYASDWYGFWLYVMDGANQGTFLWLIVDGAHRRLLCITIGLVKLFAQFVEPTISNGEMHALARQTNLTTEHGFVKDNLATEMESIARRLQQNTQQEVTDIIGIELNGVNLPPKSRSYIAMMVQAYNVVKDQEIWKIFAAEQEHEHSMINKQFLNQTSSKRWHKERFASWKRFWIEDVQHCHPPTYDEEGVPTVEKPLGLYIGEVDGSLSRENTSIPMQAAIYFRHYLRDVFHQVLSEGGGLVSKAFLMSKGRPRSIDNSENKDLVAAVENILTGEYDLEIAETTRYQRKENLSRKAKEIYTGMESALREWVSPSKEQIALIMNSAVSTKIQQEVFGINHPVVPVVQEHRVHAVDEEEHSALASTGVELAMLYAKLDSTEKSTWKHMRYQYLMLCFLNELGLEDQVNDIPDEVGDVLKYLTRQLERSLLPQQFPPPVYARWMGDQDYVGFDATKAEVLQSEHQKAHAELDWTIESTGATRKYETYSNSRKFEAALENVWEVLPGKSRLKICAAFSPPWGVLKDTIHDEALSDDEIQVCLFTCIPCLYTIVK